MTLLCIRPQNKWRIPHFSTNVVSTLLCFSPSPFLQLSLEAFYSISSMLRALATMPWPGMHSLRFALFVSIILVIFGSALIYFKSNYATQCLFLTHSLVFCSLCCPAIHLKSRELLWPRWESLPNPLIERREEWNRPGCGGAGAFIPHPYPPPPTHGRAESHPLASLHPIAHLYHFTPSCAVSRQVYSVVMNSLW